MSSQNNEGYTELSVGLLSQQISVSTNRKTPGTNVQIFVFSCQFSLRFFLTRPILTVLACIPHRTRVRMLVRSPSPQTKPAIGTSG
jgi:hypothetical protein